MTEHQQMINAIKSDMLSLCVDSDIELNSFSEYFRFISQCLQKHFEIKYSTFLKCEGDLLKPINSEIVCSLTFSSLPYALVDSYFEQQKVVDIPYFLRGKIEFKSMTHMILLKVGKKNPSGVLLFQTTSQWERFNNSEYAEEFINLISIVTETMSNNLEIRLNENQYRKLYSMTDLFHSTMDIDLILQNVLVTIRENFPNFRTELILSNDQDRQTTINIKPFDYLSERPSTIEAFVSGEITTEQDVDLNCLLLNAPIKGRQAIYGILQVTVPIDYSFTATQKEFIRMLAHASGNALENAKLYHQSYRLISDLQLINETSHKLNMRLDINDMLIFLQKQLMKSCQPMELCFVFIENGKYEITKSSTTLFKTEEGNVYIKHAENHFKNTKDPLFIADFSRLISDEIKYKSMMAIPMIVEDCINGFSIVLHRDPYFFSFDSFKLMQSLIHHSSLAIANSRLRNQLQEMVDRDHLTKLFARSYLDQFVENSLVKDDSGMFLLIDIDNFKRVNDTYGHQVGDEVLIQIGEQLEKTVGTRGICARWGGEEMSVYIPNILDDEALKVAKQIVDVIPNSTEPKVTISAGLITWHKSNRPEFQTVFLHADTALYTAKNNGKNQVRIFDNSMQLQH
ncbi:sensor domain-containing diguanylate cyclase [Solibacillus sp. CAU 1738]|uniref:sensor domain-containing diguanylate cyclase n=1 Tax=Solibacillus sp. CAU 1738 TaxID=3140363 RepID=UPI0032615B28